ncbi:hypothetical protein FPJ27_12780 [Burkholderia sp. MS455]|nr:hypothetical protein FPJ27_12780 [Burkholderia sp. MS455]
MRAVCFFPAAGGPAIAHRPIPFLEITPDKKVDASHDEPLPSPPSNYMECSVNTDASCSWCSTNLTAA